MSVCVWVGAGGAKAGEAAILQAGSERLAGTGIWDVVLVVVVGGLGVFRKYMERSSNPVRKCGLR